MSLRNNVERGVNSALALGLIILLLGIGLWLVTLSQRLQLSLEAMLILFGLMFLLFAAMAAKVMSKVEN